MITIEVQLIYVRASTDITKFADTFAAKVVNEAAKKYAQKVESLTKDLKCAEHPEQISTIKVVPISKGKITLETNFCCSAFANTAKKHLPKRQG